MLCTWCSFSFSFFVFRFFPWEVFVLAPRDFLGACPVGHRLSIVESQFEIINNNLRLVFAHSWDQFEVINNNLRLVFAHLWDGCVTSHLTVLSTRRHPAQPVSQPIVQSWRGASSAVKKKTRTQKLPYIVITRYSSGYPDLYPC